MVFRVYHYLDEQEIGIDAPENILGMAEGNIEEEGIQSSRYESLVKSWEGPLRKIIRDKSRPYLSIIENKERDLEGYDYFRYRTLTQTRWKIDNCHYEVRNNILNDESGVLKCFKKIYFALESAKHKALIHSAAIDVNDQGILLVGRKRSGKTTLAFNIIDRLNASMVEGGTSLVSYDSGLKASYLPRPIFARFSTIVESEYLRPILGDLELAEAHQPWDLEGIREVIEAKNFLVDGGLNFSRRAFRKLSGRRTLRSTNISTIIFPTYSAGEKVKICSVSIEEAHKRMLEREFKMDTSLGNIKDQDDDNRPKSSIIDPSWLEGIRLITVSFDGNKDVTDSLLEDLVAC